MDTKDKFLKSIDDQMYMAWKVFDDQQALIRAADIKAGYLVTFLLFFGASTIPLGEQVLPKLHWANLFRAFSDGLYLATYVGMAFGFVWSLYLISHVLTPRKARHHQSAAEGLRLLYYEHVLQHPTSSAYFEAVSQASSEQILHNITDQAYELARISKAKMDALRDFSRSFKWTVAAWCVSTALGFWIMTWK